MANQEDGPPPEQPNYTPMEKAKLEDGTAGAKNLHSDYTPMKKAKLEDGTAGTKNLHSDLLGLVLQRLPIKWILRCTSVCQEWYRLITSPIFVKNLHRIAKTANLPSLLVHTRSYVGNAHRFSLLLDCSDGNPIVEDLNSPLQNDDLVHVKSLGAINGLVCLSLCRKGISIMLWNPAMRRHRLIPPSNLVWRGKELASVGFGYDEATDSYKFVRILYSKSMAYGEVTYRFEVYSTQTDTWRTIEGLDFPEYILSTEKCGSVIAGVPYWLALNMHVNEERFFVWFDASEEIFRVHSYLDNDVHSEILYLEIMGEEPAQIYLQHQEDQSEAQAIQRINISKLRKGRDSFSIEKLTVEPAHQLQEILGFWRNNQIIALDQLRSLVSYDIHSSQIQNLPSYADWGRPFVYNYTESIVWPF